MISYLNPSLYVTDENRMTQVFRTWADAVTQLDMLSGSGSPDGVVEALPRRMYMDTAGTAGAILYIKRDADVGGNRKLGWVLV